MNRKPYPTDLQDSEWGILKPLLPEAKPGGQPRRVDMREVLSGIFYWERSGCSWDRLPHDLPATKTVYDYFNKWSQDGTWERINGVWLRRVRQAEGRDPEPRAGIIWWMCRAWS